MKMMLASAFALILPASVAQVPAPDLGTVRVPAYSSQIELPSKYSRIWLGEFANVAGTYRLVNGQLMELSMRGNRKFVRVGSAPRTEVIAVGDYEYVALSREVRVVLFDPDGGDMIGYVSLARRPDSTASHAPVVETIGLIASR